MNEVHIKVWAWNDAPEEYRRMSSRGGDEDWVMLLSGSMDDELLGWSSLPIFDWLYGEEPDYVIPLGHVDRKVLDNGDVVLIFAHA